MPTAFTPVPLHNKLPFISTNNDSYGKVSSQVISSASTIAGCEINDDQLKPCRWKDADMLPKVELNF